MFIGLYTEDGLDQICTTTAQATRETRDLRAMGCKVRAHKAPEDVLYDIDAALRDGLTWAKAIARAAAPEEAAAPETGGFPLWAAPRESRAPAHLLRDIACAVQFARGLA